MRNRREVVSYRRRGAHPAMEIQSNEHETSDDDDKNHFEKTCRSREYPEEQSVAPAMIALRCSTAEVCAQIKRKPDKPFRLTLLSGAYMEKIISDYDQRRERNERPMRKIMAQCQN